MVGHGWRFGYTTAVAWEHGAIRNLGRIGGDEAAGLSASTNGDIVVGFSDVSGGRPVPARFAGGPPEPLADWQVAWRASAVSGDGSVIVGRGTTEAFRIDAGGYSTLGWLPGHAHSYAMGVSESGSVIVGTSSTAWSSIDPGRAFRWQGGTMEALPTAGIFDYRTEAWDISPDGGAVAGRAGNDDGTWHAVLWTDAAGAMDLGALPLDDPGAFGAPSSMALGVSRDGRVVVGISGRSGSTVGMILDQRPFLWTPELGTVDLKGWLEVAWDLDLTGWRLDDAMGVSDDGTVIVGNGVDPQRRARAWVAVVPGPGSGAAALLAAAAAGLGRGRARAPYRISG